MQPNPVKDLALSVVRTLVPMVVTYLIGVLTQNFGPLIDESTKVQIAALLYACAFGAYYLVVRLAERYVSPLFSWFLGDFRKGRTEPVYPDATETTIVPPAQP